MENWWHGVVAALANEASSFCAPSEIVQGFFRLLAAAAAGAILGVQRERMGKSAGLRTHMLVALGSALMIVASLAAGMTPEHVSRVMQGVAAGLGFIGGGVILKLTAKREVRGLTTAAGLWMTAALGMAAGLGRYPLVLFGAALAWLILAFLRRCEMEAGEAKH